jgi:hypothetical protein
MSETTASIESKPTESSHHNVVAQSHARVPVLLVAALVCVLGAATLAGGWMGFVEGSL